MPLNMPGKPLSTHKTNCFYTLVVKVAWARHKLSKRFNSGMNFYSESLKSFSWLPLVPLPTKSMGAQSTMPYVLIFTIGHVQISTLILTLCGKKKTIMIIDEISMVGQTLLNTINQQCTKIRATQQDSTAILSAMPIVVFFGDFHQ